MDFSSIKLLAKKQIKGQLLNCFLATIIANIFCVISLGLLFPIFSFGFPLGMGFIYLAKDMRDGKGASIGRIFSPFKDFVRTMLTNYLTWIFLSLWNALVLIPCLILYSVTESWIFIFIASILSTIIFCIKSLSYFMAPFILADNPNISPVQAITESRKIMNGHKMDLFLLGLSFIGWGLLVLITFGLLYIYVFPYMLMTLQNFYDRIKNNDSNTNTLPDSEPHNENKNSKKSIVLTVIVIIVAVIAIMTLFILGFDSLSQLEDDEGLEWSKVSEKEMIYARAENYCRNLIENDHDDWRVPTVDELKTIALCPKTTSDRCKVSEREKCLATSCAGVSQSDLVSEKNNCLCSNPEDMPKNIEKRFVELIRKFNLTQETVERGMKNQSSLSLEDRNKFEKFSVAAKELLEPTLTSLWSSSPVYDIPESKWVMLIGGAGIVPVVLNNGGGYIKTGSTSYNVKCVRGKNLCEDNNYCEKIENSSGRCIPQSTGYSCICLDGYFWDGKNCVTPCEPDPCLSVANSTHCIASAVDRYSCGCKKDYFWNEGKCVSPCESDPCSSVANSTHCIASAADKYSCGCEDGYFWDGKNCVSPCESNPCSEIAHSISCIASAINEYSCSCEDDYIWNNFRCIPELHWSSKASNIMNWDDAVNYCNNLNEDGHSDWRLPDIDELRTLIKNCPTTETGGECKVSEKSGCLSNDDCWEPQGSCYCENRSGDYYSNLGDNDLFWSSSTMSNNSYDAWSVYFNQGLVAVSDKHLNLYNVRCVRGAKETEINSKKRFSKPTKIGNLQWSNKAPNKMELKDAKNYCKNLNENAYIDWRLPNIDEMRTLIQNHSGTKTGGSCKISEKTGNLSGKDWTQKDCQGHRDTNSYSKLGDQREFWSSSELGSSPPYVWYVDFHNGGINEISIHPVNRLYFRCIRGRNNESSNVPSETNNEKNIVDSQEKETKKDEKNTETKVSIGKIKVNGTNDFESVAKTIKFGSSVVERRCYSEALLTNPTLKGKVSVIILINEKGRVENIEISEDTLKDTEIIKCVRGIISRLRFQEPDEGKTKASFQILFNN